MSAIQSYRDLVAWQKAFQVGVAAHELSARFPDHERFGLTAQIRRHATLIASLIADGFGQQNTGDYLRFLRQARGALYHLDTQMLFALRFGYVEEEPHRAFAAKIEEALKVLTGLLKSLNG